MTPGTGRTTHSKYFCGPSDTPKSAGACVSCVCSAVQKTFWSQKSTSNSPLIFSPFLLETVSLAQAALKQTCLRWPNPSSLCIPRTEILWAFITRAYYQLSSILISPSTDFFKRFIFILCGCVYMHVPALHVLMCSTCVAGTL